MVLTEFRYQLEKGSKKHICPNCQKKTFVPYIDGVSGAYLPSKYGRCDRVLKCNYQLNPYKDGHLKDEAPAIEYKLTKPKPKPIECVPFDVFSQSRKHYEQNNFVQWLIATIGADAANEVVSKYHLGTSKHIFKNRDFPDYESTKGATVFWQIDRQGKIRTGKIMLYHEVTGRRVKEPFNHVSWVHKKLKTEHEQIFFGSHLLNKHGNVLMPVGILESEKSACIASHYLKGFVWLACGSLTMLTKERCEYLKGRNVTFVA